MRLDNRQLHDFFKNKGIDFLYHANTVATSITFFEQGGLLSRGAIENLELYQTKQTSDDIDKQFNVWNDIFLDSIDLHHHFNRQNKYGPVLFEFDIELLLNYNYEVWITKDNPIRWNGTFTDDKKYFVSMEELNEKWNKINRHEKMITIRNNNKPILFEFINTIILDNPKIKVRELRLYSNAYNSIIEAVNERLYHNLSSRYCKKGCYCRANYLNEVTGDDSMTAFLPKDKLEKFSL